MKVIKRIGKKRINVGYKIPSFLLLKKGKRNRIVMKENNVEDKFFIYKVRNLELLAKKSMYGLKLSKVSLRRIFFDLDYSEVDGEDFDSCRGFENIV